MEQIKILSPIKIVGNLKSKAVAGQVTGQPDLLYMHSLLVSTGSNLNDDVFLPEEMWKARSSPKLKPVNWEHNSGRELTAEERSAAPDKIVIDNQIIGVMHNSYATDENGVIISEEKTSAADFEIPSSFHIEDEAIIWKSLYPNAAARIEKGAAEGTLFVSMEAWFTDYNYLVGNKVIARNEQTAFLDKNLKANGGTGSFGNLSVKRVLRNIVFGGKGIVERPANEPSVIKSVTHQPITAGVLENKAIASNIIGDIGLTTNLMEESDKMTDNKTVNQIAAVSLDQYTKMTEEAVALRAEVKTANANLEDSKSLGTELSEQLETIKSAFSKGTKALEKAIPGISEKLENADVAEFFNVLAEAITAKDAETTEANQKLTEVSEKLAEVEANVRASKRLEQIKAELSLSAAEGDTDDVVKAKVAQAEKIAEETKNLDDEAFASRIADFKSLLTLAAKPDFLKKKGEDDEDDKKKKKDAKASDGITDEMILDSVKASETMTPGTEDNDAPELNMQKAYSGLASIILNANKRTDSTKNEKN